MQIPVLFTNVFDNSNNPVPSYLPYQDMIVFVYSNDFAESSSDNIITAYSDFKFVSIDTQIYKDLLATASWVSRLRWSTRVFKWRLEQLEDLERQIK